MIYMYVYVINILSYDILLDALEFTIVSFMFPGKWCKIECKLSVMVTEMLSAGYRHQLRLNTET